MSDTSRADSIRRIRSALDRCSQAIIEAEASDEVLAITAEAAEDYARRFDEASGSQRLWGFIGSRKNDIRGALILGSADAPAPIRASTEGDFATAVVTVGHEYEGPEGSVHGGHIAWLFDEICALAQSVNTTRRAKTSSLSVRYLVSAPLGQPLHLSASVTAIGERRITVTAELRHGETVCATAEAEFAQFTQDGRRASTANASSPSPSG